MRTLCSQVFTDAVATAKAQQEAAEAERQRLANEAAAQAQQTAEADAAARDRWNAASTESVIQNENQWAMLLQGMIFVPTDAQADPTQAEAERSNLATLMMSVMRGVMWNNKLLQAHLLTERQQRQKHQQDMAALIAAARAAATQQQQQQQLLNSTLARINSIEGKASAAPGCTTDATKQLNERIDHVVTIIGELGDFTSPATISSTVAAIKTSITKLQTRSDAATKNYKMPHFDISKFDDYNKTDALTWWQSFLTEASCRTVPADNMMKALYLQLIGVAHAWMNHLAATKKCTIAELHTHITWKEFSNYAPELARLLHTGWITNQGVPKDIVSDRDTRFMSAFWTSLMAESGTTMKPSSARHPQTDGQTERAHQTAQMMLRTLIRPNQKDWVDRLPDIEFAYNTSVHPAICITPFELHHGGEKARIFADLHLPQAANIDVPCSPASVRKYRDLLIKARANMQKAQIRMQQQVNRHRLPCPFREGDLVWVLSKEFALELDVLRKLLPKWFGPWEVTSAVGDDPAGPSFVVNIPPHRTLHQVFHASKLAIYTPPSADEFPGRRSQDPPSMDGHQEVDGVITHRKYGNKPMQFKVTFKQCAPDDTRWISSADLQTSAPLIFADYEKRRLAKEAARNHASQQLSRTGQGRMGEVTRQEETDRRANMGGASGSRGPTLRGPSQALGGAAREGTVDRRNTHWSERAYQGSRDQQEEELRHTQFQEEETYPRSQRWGDAQEPEQGRTLPPPWSSREKWAQSNVQGLANGAGLIGTPQGELGNAQMHAHWQDPYQGPQEMGQGNWLQHCNALPSRTQQFQIERPNPGYPLEAYDWRNFAPQPSGRGCPSLGHTRWEERGGSIRRTQRRNNGRWEVAREDSWRNRGDTSQPWRRNLTTHSLRIREEAGNQGHWDEETPDGRAKKARAELTKTSESSLSRIRWGSECYEDYGDAHKSDETSSIESSAGSGIRKQKGQVISSRRIPDKSKRAVTLERNQMEAVERCLVPILCTSSEDGVKFLSLLNAEGVPHIPSKVIDKTPTPTMIMGVVRSLYGEHVPVRLIPKSTMTHVIVEMMQGYIKLYFPLLDARIAPETTSALNQTGVRSFQMDLLRERNWQELEKIQVLSGVSAMVLVNVNKKLMGEESLHSGFLATSLIED
ncbi:hypothetical protein CBR_g20050 [Chara braunii]|uniref:Integrase catalytic domain-containing protein n=1 Tax=Chara braunii TaxID=69332 RepID=A0A388KZD5_CHABU|nr:hypothetical protein CBR_g20050 [Chara braunii]|eukprot:GBG75420.1 hypothetical protein CBR_g20050 [Chara braunii]